MGMGVLSGWRSPPVRRVPIFGQSFAEPKKGLAADQIFGEYRRRQTFDISPVALCFVRTLARPLVAGFVFLGLAIPFFRATDLRDGRLPRFRVKSKAIVCDSAK
jgi:hypothetical protein